MKIAIGCDHGGFDMKTALIAYLKEQGHEIKDYGCYDKSSIDYPDYVFPVGEAVVRGEYDRGIVICGSGVGISIAANKVKGARCVCCSEPYSALLSRQHNNTNVLAFGSRVVGPGLATMIVDAWITGQFEGGRHAGRVQMLADIEAAR